MTASYRPGRLAAWIAADALVVTDVEHVEALRSLRAGTTGSAPSALAVIGALSAGDLRNVPDFVAVLVDGESIRVVVRGPYVVTAGESSISGDGVATWVEQLVAAADRVQVGDGRDVTWPVGEGLVLVDSVVWSPQPALVASAQVPMVAAVAELVREALPEPEPEPEPELEPGPEPEVPASPPSDPFATRAEDDDVFDDMFGATIHGRRPEDAAIRENVEVAPTMVEAPRGPLVPEPAQAETPDAALGDHDGRTMTFAQLQELRRRNGSNAPAAEPAVTELAAPRRPRMTLTVAGEEVVCDRTVLLGRAPRTEQASSAELPIIVVIDDPYVSSTHLEISFADDTPVATDRSTNGTLLSRDGGAPERMGKGIAAVLTDRSVLMLSEDVAVTVRIEA